MFMNNSNEQNEVIYLYLDDIIPNRFQPRERFDEGALRELAASIKEHGVIQPIIVRKIGDKYEIIAGERRYKASALAGLTKIPAIIRNLDDKETSKVALLENLQRKNLSAIEEARTYQKILDLDQMTQFELAKTMGKSQPVIANKLRLLTLPDEVQEALLKEQISERHARSLLSLENAEDQIEMLHKIINNRMTVRETDEEVRKRATTDNFGLPGLESTENVSKPEANTSIDKMPQPIPLNMDEKTEEQAISSINPIFDQNVVNVPDVNTIRQQSIDINNVNQPQLKTKPSLENIQTQLSETIENEQQKSVVPLEDLLKGSNDVSVKENKDEKPLINLEDLLNEAKEVPIEEKNEEKESKQQEQNQTEELLEKIESSDQMDTETLEVEELNNNEKPLPSVVDTQSINVFDLRLAISNIRDKIEELQEKGIKIDSEEIDFEKQYQIIIKIEK